VGKADVFGQARLGLGVAEIVAHVDEIGAPGTDGFRRFDGGIERQMGGVRRVAQGIEHKHRGTAGGLDRLRGDRLAVGVISQKFPTAAGKDKSCRNHASVWQINGCHAQPAEVKGSFDGHGGGPHVIAELVGSVEGVMENAREVREGGRGCMDGHRLVFDFAKAAQIVEAQDVVCVGVREDDGVNAHDLFPQTLEAQVGGGVDQDAGGSVPEQGRGAQPFVARITRGTHAARAPDDRDAMRGARPEEGDLQFLHVFLLRGHTGILCPMSATLASLQIRNLALVEDLLWEPRPGFTVITGETGAGKSVILGALGLLLGERADRSLVRSGEQACHVEAVFEGVDDARVARALEEAGAGPCEEGRLLLKRVVQAGGAGRQFVNGSACTLALLRALGDRLVDLHGPHDHQSLFSREQQTRLLDSHASCGDALAAYAESRGRLLAKRREQEELTGGGRSLAREVDLLEHQSREIAAAGLSPEEEEHLAAKHRAAANAGRIATACATLDARLSAEQTGLLEGAAEAVRATRDLVRIDPAASPLAAAAENASTALADLAHELARYSGALETDPAAMAALEERLDLIGSLKRKYGNSLGEVIEFGARAEERLSNLRALLDRADTLDRDLAAAAQRVQESGGALTAARRAAATKLEHGVSEALADLGFPRSGFSVRLDALPAPGPLGLEMAEFVFAPNPGEDPRPLRTIASSGEISRVMLALKSVLAAQDDVPLLVFDEIDANVGGEIAVKVAARMRDLAKGRQVLCITHLPQVAAAASHHFVVAKEVSTGRTRTRLDACSGPARTEEIARMLGGKSATALAHARDLLRL
jgi:DNA repair protein RecN (Recombination protein N)